MKVIDEYKALTNELQIKSFECGVLRKNYINARKMTAKEVLDLCADYSEENNGVCTLENIRQLATVYDIKLSVDTLKINKVEEK